MQRDISSYPLTLIHKTKLRDAGFIYTAELKGVKPIQLSKEIGVSKEEALQILKIIQDDAHEKAKPMTAFEMLQDESQNQKIITFSEQFDEMLGGGIAITKITELCGAPGVGKTQLSLQLCVDVQIPDCFGGVGGQALYIDTEGSFSVTRLEQMATATISHCQQIAQDTCTPEQLQALKQFTLDDILSGVHYTRCHDYVELLATVHLLPEYIKTHSKMKLIVIDSIAFPFRHDFEDYSLRTRILNGIAQDLIRIASRHCLAVVLTNQMTTKFSHNQSKLVPALGESWGHACTIRVILYWENKVRHALLYKSPSHEERVVTYQVTTGGIRDICVTRNNAENDGTEQTL